MRASSIEIAHAIPGRVRLLLPPSMFERRRRAGIEAALDARREVIGHRFNPRGRTLVVEHSPGMTHAALRRLIAQARPAEPGEKGNPGHPDRHVKSLVAMGAGGMLAFVNPTLALPLIGLGSVAIFRRAVKRIRKGKIGVDALDATALTITVASGQVLTAAILGALVEGGELLRDLTA